MSTTTPPAPISATSARAVVNAWPVSSLLGASTFDFQLSTVDSLRRGTMKRSLGAWLLLQTVAVVYCAVDSLVPVRGTAWPGFDEFMAGLEHAGVPIVWVSSRTRFQLDSARRELGHNHPFIAEGGCGVYLPEDYFHLRPAKAMRLGRFTCIPIAEPQPAASEALEELSGETGVSVVTLASLRPRELAQNLGVPVREAELARHRDFDEPFFFAGSSSEDIERFVAAARDRNLQLRQDGMLWSLAVGANLKQCVTHLAKLYDRALRSHPTVLGIATPEEAKELFPACDRTVLLSDEGRDADVVAQHPAPLQKSGTEEEGEVGHAAEQTERPQRGLRASREIPLAAPDVWERVLEGIVDRRRFSA